MPANAETIELQPSRLLEPTELMLAQVGEDSSSFKDVVLERHGLTEESRKSPWRALGSSLLIPGWGQHYIGSDLKSKVFFGAEVGFLGALAVFRHEGAWREDDYRLLAQLEAGADLTDKDERFYDVVGFYESREDYNKLGGVYNRGQEYYPDNSFYFWKWNSEAAQLRYRDLKNQSKTYYRNSDFVLGLLIANHVVSAVDAFFGAKRHNRRINSGFWGVDLRVPETGGFLVTVRAGF
ncbi:MAG: DUF5683 domain-containing protein [bacterium]